MYRLWIALTLCALQSTVVLAQTSKRPAINSLKPEARKALLTALTHTPGEYAGVALYSKIVQKFGSVEPYSYLLRKQIKQRTALQKLFQNYLIPYADNPYLKTARVPSSLKQAVDAGAELAVRKVAKYDKLLLDVTENADITRVFLKLQSETRDVHLPLLKAAAENGGVLPPKRRGLLKNQ